MIKICGNITLKDEESAGIRQEIFHDITDLNKFLDKLNESKITIEVINLQAIERVSYPIENTEIRKTVFSLLYRIPITIEKISSFKKICNWWRMKWA